MILLKDSLVNSQSYPFTQKADIWLIETQFKKMDPFIHRSTTPTYKNKHVPFKAKQLALSNRKNTSPATGKPEKDIYF